MKVTDRQRLAAWLGQLCEHLTVIAPRMVEETVLYRPIGSSRDVLWDFQRAAMSPKTWLLPSTATLFEIDKTGQTVTISEAAPEDDQILFAVRPCDARALGVLDALLTEHQPADAAYAARRQRTAIVGLACPQLWPECFCTSIGGAPDDTSGVDIMLYQDGDDYLVEAVSARGQQLLEGTQDGVVLAAEETQRSAPASDRSGPDVSVMASASWPQLFGDLFWQRFSERCLSCHACTYVCPTCRCFDVRDYTTSAGAGRAHIERVRSWDSCMAAAYRRIAGGHNPRPSKMHRLRNRYYCKFNYCPEDFGVVACVGCGRCIAVCPVGVDITEMLRDVAALSEAASPAEGRADD